MKDKKRKDRSKPGQFIKQNRLPKEKPSLSEVIREFTQGISKKEWDVKETENGEDYWAWMEKHGQQTEDGDIIESPQANPDVLANDEIVPMETVSPIQHEYRTVREGINTVLTEKERHIMMLVIDGFSQDKIAHNLGIKQPSVIKHIKTARKKLEAYVKENEDKWL